MNIVWRNSSDGVLWVRFQQNYLRGIIFTIFLWGTLTLSGQSFTWYQPDFPPYVILDGPDKNLGIDNQIVESMIEELSQYEHVFEVANYARILENLKQRKTGIITPLFKTTSREAFVHYSNSPSYLVYPNGFIYRISDREKYTPFILEDGTLDIEELCRSGLFNIGINAGRSYYGILDETIGQFSEENVYYIRTARDNLGILKMVCQKRIDAALGFPIEIKYAGMDKELGFFSVSEMAALTPVYFGTSKSPDGIRLMEELDIILEDERWQERFAQYYKYWLDDEMNDDYDILRRNYYKNF